MTGLRRLGPLVMPWVWCAAGLGVALTVFPPWNKLGGDPDTAGFTHPGAWVWAEINGKWHDGDSGRTLVLAFNPDAATGWSGAGGPPTEETTLGDAEWGATWTTTVVNPESPPGSRWRTVRRELRLDLWWLLPVPLLWSALWLAWRLRPTRRAAAA